MANILSGLALILAPLLATAQDRNPQAAVDTRAADAELVRTAATECDKLERSHFTIYFDKRLLSASAQSAFADRLEAAIPVIEKYLRLRSRPGEMKKADYYVTNRAGISHARTSFVVLFAQRVIPDGFGIAVHETVHMLLAHRSRPPTRSPNDTGSWLFEGLAGYVEDELADDLHYEPSHLFVKGTNATVHDEARTWLRDERGRLVLPNVGSEGQPPNLLTDRQNVAPPFYVASQSFTKFLIDKVGIEKILQVYETHFNSNQAMRKDFSEVTGLPLADLRRQWLDYLGINK